MLKKLRKQSVNYQKYVNQEILSNKKCGILSNSFCCMVQKFSKFPQKKKQVNFENSCLQYLNLEVRLKLSMAQNIVDEQKCSLLPIELCNFMHQIKQKYGERRSNLNQTWYPGSLLIRLQSSMFMAQSGPLSLSLVAL